VVSSAHVFEDRDVWSALTRKAPEVRAEFGSEQSGIQGAGRKLGKFVCPTYLLRLHVQCFGVLLCTMRCR
jgi:hypothetical protein